MTAERLGNLRTLAAVRWPSAAPNVVAKQAGHLAPSAWWHRRLMNPPTGSVHGAD